MSQAPVTRMLHIINRTTDRSTTKIRRIIRPHRLHRIIANRKVWMRSQFLLRLATIRQR